MTCPACKQHDPGPQCQACHYTCLTCGLHLHGKNEVWGHWVISFSGHSVFVDTKGHHYHQTVEGLHRRENWEVAGEVERLEKRINDIQYGGEN